MLQRIARFWKIGRKIYRNMKRQVSSLKDLDAYSIELIELLDRDSVDAVQANRLMVLLGIWEPKRKKRR
tara:strand:- start:309 stop:515 length:207 start_codon:yes stop_codon:yes gene_type:complete